MGIAGMLMANSEVGRKFTRDIARRLAPEQGEQFVDLAEDTTQGVARGILGVAVVQALLAGMGMLVAGVPGAGILAMVCLITGAVQIGIWPVMVGATIYMWIEAATLPALLFTAWAVVVTPVDGILRPIWIGRGLDLPITLLLVGTIGGMLAFGIIGIFAGAVVLAIGYKLLMSWLKPEGEPETA
jgi:predicted PurR-regulated permease PerM